MSYLGDQRPINYIFWHIKLDDIDGVTKYTCTTIKGTHDIHFMRFIGFMDANKLLKKSLSYFCCLCVDTNFLACQNVPWTQSWEVEVLIHDNASYVCSAMAF